MPFGSADRELLRQVSNQLGQITADLAALKQQAADQQHAIDQTRQDTTAAITTGLAENRAVVRDGLHRHQEAIGDPLSRIGSELVALRGAINDIGHSRPPAVATVETEPPAEDGSQPDPRTNDELLRAAAGISRAQVRAHRDTWAFLVEHAIRDRHFRLPGNVVDDSGPVMVYVSGPSLVAAITSLDQVSRTSDSTVTRAIAGHLHDRLTETVQAIINNPHRGDGAEEVHIIIDDRAKAAEDEQQ